MLLLSLQNVTCCNSSKVHVTSSEYMYVSNGNEIIETLYLQTMSKLFVYFFIFL